MRDFFISYNSADRRWAEWIAWQLEEAGYTTLLLVRVRECELKGLLGQIVYTDLVGLNEKAARQALLEGVKRGRRKPALAPAFPGKVERSVPERPHFPGTRRRSGLKQRYVL